MSLCRLNMKNILLSLVFLSLTTCPVSTANTCGVAPNGDTICLNRVVGKYDPAKMTCEGMQEHLVEILDQPTQDFINNNLIDAGMDMLSSFWIGLKKDMGVFKWEYSGTDTGGYSNWGPSSNQNSDCGFLSGFDLMWDSVICAGDLQGYFCQKAGTLTTDSSNVQPTTEAATTSLTTIPPSTTQRPTTAISTTTGAKDFTTTNKPTTVETTTLTTLPPSTTEGRTTAILATTGAKDFTTTEKPTTVETTTMTSRASSTTVKEATTETLTTTRDETTVGNGLTTLQTTTLTSLPLATTTQKQFTYSMIQTTHEETESPTARHSTSKTVSTRPTFTTKVDEPTITTLPGAETTKQKSTAEGTVEKTTDTETTTIPPLMTSDSTFISVPSYETSTEETTVSGTTTEPSTTNETPVRTADPTTAKTTRFISTTPRGTTRVETSTEETTSLLSKGFIQSTQTDQTQPTYTTEEISMETINSTTSSISDLKELSTEACNGHCDLTLEERLANATLDEVNSIVENEDLDSEDILHIQRWFEDNTYIRKDEENYLRYVKRYLKAFNEILILPKDGTFELANPAIFAESCNEILEDFANKSSFNATLEISFSSIETELVRQPLDTFQGFTSDFNIAQNEEHLDGYVSIENGWVEDYNTTDNSTIDIIVVLYQVATVESLGNDETNEIVSSFVSITVVVDGEPVSLPVIFGLELDEEKLRPDEGKQINLEPLCVFWDYSFDNDSTEGYWNTFGCEVLSQNATYVLCRCNHTTSFAVLMQITEIEISPEDEAALSLLSLIGLGISTAALLITIIVLSCLQSLKSDRVFIHKHLVVALIIAQTLFISTIGAVHHELICKLVAIFLHYSYLAVFMWMLIEGVHLYLEIVQVFSRFDGKTKTIHYVVTGWGAPLIIVGVAVAIRWKNYGVGKGCWLSIDDGLIWAFVGPVAFVIVTNFIILLMVIRVVFRASSARGKDESEYKHLIAALKGALFLLPLLGLTWTVGFMSVNEGTLVFQYLFVVLNSLQGLFIFLFYCAMNKEVKTALSRKFSQVALESGGSKSLTLKAMAKLKSSGSSTSPVLRLTDSSGKSRSSGVHSEDDGKREAISASGISVHQKEPDGQDIQMKTEQSKSPFSPDYE